MIQRPTNALLDMQVWHMNSPQIWLNRLLIFGISLVANLDYQQWHPSALESIWHKNWTPCVGILTSNLFFQSDKRIWHLSRHLHMIIMSEVPLHFNFNLTYALTWIMNMTSSIWQSDNLTCDIQFTLLMWKQWILYVTHFLQQWGASALGLLQKLCRGLPCSI